MNEQRAEFNFDSAYEVFDKVLFGLICRRIEVMAVRNNVEAALDILARYLRGPKTRTRATMESALHNVLRPRIANALEQNGYDNLTVLDGASDEDLLVLENFSTETVNQIRKTLEQIRAGVLWEGVDDPSLYLDADPLPLSSPQTLTPKDKSMANQISDAVGVLLDAPSEALIEIDDRIESLEKQIARLKAVRKLFGDRSSRSSSSKKPGAGNLRLDKWADQITEMKDYIEDHGPSSSGDLGRAIGLTPMLVGRIAKFSELFYVDGNKLIGLAN